MDERIRVAHTTRGSLLYLVEGPPSALPPVRSGDLREAWLDAGHAARRGAWSQTRLIRFQGARGGFDMILADADACCWTGAVDRQHGLHTRYGLSLCLRLLSLIALMARRARLPSRTVRLRAAALQPGQALLRLASVSPLTEQAELDELWLTRRLDPSPLTHAEPGVLL